MTPKELAALAPDYVILSDDGTRAMTLSQVVGHDPVWGMRYGPEFAVANPARLRTFCAEHGIAVRVTTHAWPHLDIAQQG